MLGYEDLIHLPFHGLMVHVFAHNRVNRSVGLRSSMCRELHRKAYGSNLQRGRVTATLVGAFALRNGGSSNGFAVAIIHL